MPKLPRNIGGHELIILLKKYQYHESRQTGSHIRLKSVFKGYEHNITIPNHNPIAVGTLNNIISEISRYLNIDKINLINEIFH